MLTDIKTPTVLLVEDSEDDAFFFRRTFLKSGATCSLRHVTNGVEAVEFLRESAAADHPVLPQVMFLDLKMPVLNGFEVLDWMRQQKFHTPIQVIILSGSEQEEDKERAMELGASDYLVKPVKVADLRRCLRDICPHETGVPV